MLEVAVAAALPPEKDGEEGVRVQRHGIRRCVGDAVGDGLRGDTEEVRGERVRHGGAGGGVLEPEGVQERARDGGAEGGGAGQRILEESAEAVPRRGWRGQPRAVMEAALAGKE
uniref:Uncharacterized protein n=1 Tax=Ananas comosus var. bracteatus TaxID=296719 RepID=A0A6V7QBF2_ANACO|nr:unnamed protein product [Ananas comosus var. bracteatus]